MAGAPDHQHQHEAITGRALPPVATSTVLTRHPRPRRAWPEHLFVVPDGSTVSRATRELQEVAMPSRHRRREGAGRQRDVVAADPAVRRDPQPIGDRTQGDLRELHAALGPPERPPGAGRRRAQLTRTQAAPGRDGEPEPPARQRSGQQPQLPVLVRRRLGHRSLKAWAEARAGGSPYAWGTGVGVSHTKGPNFAFTPSRRSVRQVPRGVFLRSRASRSSPTSARARHDHAGRPAGRTVQVLLSPLPQERAGGLPDRHPRMPQTAQTSPPATRSRLPELLLQRSRYGHHLASDNQGENAATIKMRMPRRPALL